MEEALSRLGSKLPDIVLTDIGLPGMDGIEGIKILKQEYPDLLLVMLSVYDDDERIFDATFARLNVQNTILRHTKNAC